MLAAALALAPLLARYIPDIVGWLGGDDAEQVAGQVISVVQAATGSVDPEVASAALMSDPQRGADLALGLARISAEREKAKDAARLAALQASLADVAGARAQTVALAGSGSKIAFAVPILSIVIVTGFFSCVIMVFLIDKSWDERTANLANVLFGGMLAAFTQVGNYWLGSTRDSALKDERNNAALVVATDTARQAIVSAPATAAAVAAATTEAVRPLFGPRT